MVSNHSFVKFFFELGMLKEIQRTGWKLLGITDPETVAAHSLRAAQIGYILASLEEYDHPEKVASMLVFHDIGECRIGDIHKVANRYVISDEKTAVSDQLRPLDSVGEKILDFWDEIETSSTTAGIIAKDADLLEMVVTAVELNDRTGVDTMDWINNTEKRLRTRSAKKLIENLRDSHSTEWWHDLKKI